MNDGYQLMRQFILDVDRKHLVVIRLDQKHQPTTINCCQIGGVNISNSHPREIFKAALLINAASIMVGH